MKVIDWVDYDDVEAETYQDISNEEWDEAVAALIEHIRENNNPISGFQHQDEPGGVPLFDNGKVLTCTFRTWGGIMYEALNPEGNDPMGYCEWAWIAPERSNNIEE